MILQAVLNGILFGGVYVCIGTGFSLAWEPLPASEWPSTFGLL